MLGFTLHRHTGKHRRGNRQINQTKRRGNRVVARTAALVAFMLVWGTVTLITAWRNKEVPPEYWSIPALGVGGILAAFATLGDRRGREPNRPQQDADTGTTEDE